MRIRGMIGDWPVDLTVTLDPQDWAQLAAQVPSPAAPDNPPEPAGLGDGHWQAALDLLRQAGQLDGPVLLAELGALAGSTAAGKRLLVRLRHCSQVRLESGVDSPIYRWVG
ncbi:MAG: hypothetical protein V4812_03040 [Pseudomonadota bacterium]